LKVLFDTQAVVLWIAGASIPKKVERLMKKDADVYVSAISGWELLLKRRFRAIEFTIDYFWTALNAMGARLLALEGAHVNAYSKLPLIEDHRDPFDRMLIAQAITESMTLVGGDRRFRAYPVPVIWE
jgi:PIN domain nuclease of toxin-antitoxin system